MLSREAKSFMARFKNKKYLSLTVDYGTYFSFYEISSRKKTYFALYTNTHKSHEAIRPVQPKPHFREEMYPTTEADAGGAFKVPAGHVVLNKRKEAVQSRARRVLPSTLNSTHSKGTSTGIKANKPLRSFIFLSISLFLRSESVTTSFLIQTLHT